MKKKSSGVIFFSIVVAIGIFLVVYLGAQRTELDNQKFIQWRYEHAVR
jgi:hypothetical protein